MLIEEGRELTPTGSLQLYRGFPKFHSDLFNADALREQYMENIELMGEDNPGYLGELHFSGIAYFEWKYNGHKLAESEVWQVVDCIQDYASGNLRPMANGIMLPEPEHPLDESLYFKYGKDQIVSEISLEEIKGHFIVLINGDFTAQIELLEEDWEITGGDIFDPHLKEDILRRIRANT